MVLPEYESTVQAPNHPVNSLTEIPRDSESLSRPAWIPSRQIENQVVTHKSGPKSHTEDFCGIRAVYFRSHGLFGACVGVRPNFNETEH